MKTLVEQIGLILAGRGHEIDYIRQPIPSHNEPGRVAFSSKGIPAVQGVVKVWERFRKYDNAILDRIEQAERELKMAQDEWRTATETETFGRGPSR